MIYTYCSTHYTHCESDVLLITVGSVVYTVEGILYAIFVSSIPCQACRHPPVGHMLFDWLTTAPRPEHGWAGDPSTGGCAASYRRQDNGRKPGRRTGQLKESVSVG